VHPFTIRLKDRTDGAVQPVALKFDPGSKATGIGIARQTGPGKFQAVWGAELHHRGASIHKAMTSRAQYRRRRRSANLRYREPRFNNRTKPEGWLAPSLQHRIDGIVGWTQRLSKLCPLTSISVETVRFDMQKMENPEVSGVEYQQGELLGYEVREYLLEKWERKCAYCDKQNVPLEVEHVRAKSRGGSDRVSNLALACEPCNKRKKAQSIEDFLRRSPERLAKILANLKKPLKDAAAVNATRKQVLRQLSSNFGLPIEVSTGGRTKWNRCRFGIPKSHAFDALCVGEVEALDGWQGLKILYIKATGRGQYSVTDTDKYGFPKTYSRRRKRHCIGGRMFQTGCLVRVETKHGVVIGHINVRSNGTAYIAPSEPRISVSLKKCTLLQSSDGYRYSMSSPDRSQGDKSKQIPAL